MKIPFVPEDAPFSEDQKSWLSGFFAGLYTQMNMQGAPVPGMPVAAGQAQQAATPVMNVFYGTQTGNAETAAEELCDTMRSKGYAPVLAALDDVDVADLPGMEHIFVVTSTYGEGEMPDNAELFWDALKADDAPRLENSHFSVLALGDTSYDEFCEAGRQIDVRLEQLGAHRLYKRIDCDVDYEDLAAEWTEGVLDVLAERVSLNGANGSEAATIEPAAAAPTKPEKSKWTRKNPYPATIAVDRLLSREGSAKEIRHYEVDLGDDGPTYEAGDSLGVIPTNDPALVDGWLARLGMDAEQAIPGFDAPLGELLFNQWEISTPSPTFMKAIEERANDENLTHVVGHGDKEAIEAFIWSKDCLDLLNLFPQIELTSEDLATILKPLQHRAYSISSSAKVHPRSVHMTIATVRYSSHDREHGGVASTFLADRLGNTRHTDVFVAPNKAFRVPTDASVPMIMVGPGTGIAPFRAFLQERQATGASGLNWLFFGDQHASCDFIYEDELTQMKDDGVLSRIDLAFSRDQSEKVYVQHRMLEQSKDLYAALEEGGHFFVCGDATRMAKDVDKALHDVIAKEADVSSDKADDYVKTLKKEKRYVRDIY
ncbi:MAG: sulfite reductase subunit alpha [Pseudomonadota bacterium]